MPTNLFRPIGLHELTLIWDSEMREFPPRLAQQPIFYPVVNSEYAQQIARDWNSPDLNSGYAGFVTRFEISSTYLSKFDIHTAGSAAHREYWIPAKELGSFNKAINGLISVEEAFFGPQFVGYAGQNHGLEGLNAGEQFLALSSMKDPSNFISVVAANPKAIFLNCLFWLNTDPAKLGCNLEQKESFITRLVEAWDKSKIEVPLPIHLKTQ